MTSKLDHALALARRGLRVFPLVPGGKKPRISSFQLNATTDPAVIGRWFDGAWADSNIGVLTTGFVVMDIEFKEGKDGTGPYVAQGGHWDTFVVKTATGGFHAYFNGPDSMLGVNVLPGVDVRSHHGYVVAPGSTTVANGDDCVDGSYEIVVDKPMARIPPTLEALLKPPVVRIRSDEGAVDEESAILNAAEWLKTQSPAIEGMGGDNVTYKVCAALVRDYALSGETAFSLLQAHWNHRCIPPWDRDELWQKVQNAAAYGTGDRGQALPQATFGNVHVIPTPPLDGTEDQPPISDENRQRLFMGNLPLEGEITARPWIAERLLLRGDVTVFGAPGAAGKSAISIAAICHFALGKDFGDFKLRNPGVPLRTIMYNAEDDLLEQARRVSATCKAYGLNYEAVKQNIMFWDDSMGELIIAGVDPKTRAMKVNEPLVQFLIQRAGEWRVDIINLDPLVNVHNCNENDNTQMRFVLGVLRYIARMTASALLVSHHTGKGVSLDRDNADAFRGAGSIVNSARNAIILSPMRVEDVTKYAVRPIDREKYSRIDTKKANMYKLPDKPLLWIEWKSVKLPMTNETVGVPMVAAVSQRLDELGMKAMRWIRDTMIERGVGSIKLSEAADVARLTDPDGFYSKSSVSAVRANLEKVFEGGFPVVVDEDRLFLERNGREVLIKLFHEASEGE